MTLRAQILATIAANNAAQVDKTDRYLLDGKSEQLALHLRNIDRLNPDEAARYAGPNWHGPLIRQLISDSETQRGMAEQGRRAGEREAA